MFVAFKGDPVILRLYGTSKCLPRHLLEEKESWLSNAMETYGNHDPWDP
jgi:hypothetical protein